MTRRILKTFPVYAAFVFFGPTGGVHADMVTVEPTTWYEITSEAVDVLTVTPATLRVGTAPFQSPAFWEFSTSDLFSSFLSIDLVEFTASNIGRTHNIQLNTYEADAVPTEGDFFNNNLSGTFQDSPLFGFDDLFSRGRRMYSTLLSAPRLLWRTHTISWAS